MVYYITQLIVVPYFKLLLSLKLIEVILNIEDVDSILYLKLHPVILLVDLLNLPYPQVQILIFASHYE